MNTFWLKMAGFAVVVVGIIILIKVFSSSSPEPKTEQKGFYDVIEQDDKRLRAEPEAKQPPSVGAEPRFRELSETQQVQAEKLFEMALTHRKMARLPGMSYKLMVDYCRQIIEKYPDSIYAFKAKRMLADIPQRYLEQYNITEQEMKGD